MDPQSRVFGLDLIRAIAVSLVLCSHFISILLPFGVLGVEIFFVLSGYLIGGILYDIPWGKQGLRFEDGIRFWIRRWARTLPNYFLFLTIYFWIDPPTGPEHIQRYLYFCQNLLWPVPNFFNISWSLTIEELFYLILPLIFCLLSKLNLPKNASFILTCFILVVIGIYIRQKFSHHNIWDQYARKIAMGRLDALAVGCLLSFFRRFRPGLFASVQKNPILIGVSIFILTACSIDMYFRFPSGTMIFGPTLYFLITPILIALLVPAVEQIRLNSFPFMRKAITYISLWSYSIYLVHPLVLKAADFISDAESGIPLRIFAKLVSFIVILAVSCFIYNFYEKPWIRLRPRQQTVALLE